MAETKRTCGSCTACCKTHAIEELNKPAGVWCQECSIGHGCKIYVSRPPTCQDWSCELLLGVGKEEERPDMVKIVLEWRDIPYFGQTLLLFEVTEGALNNKFSQWIRKLAKNRKDTVCCLPLVGKNTIYVSRNPLPIEAKSFCTINGRETDIVYI